jgi:hypothetical protein
MAERPETICRINAMARDGKSAKEKAANQKAADDLIKSCSAVSGPTTKSAKLSKRY